MQRLCVSRRINEALVGWVKRYEDQRVLKQQKHRRRQTKVGLTLHHNLFYYLLFSSLGYVHTVLD